MTARVTPNEAMRLVLRRVKAHGREVDQVDGGPRWVTGCPTEGHIAPVVRWDQRTDGTVRVHACVKGCTVEQILVGFTLDDRRIRAYSNGQDQFTQPGRSRRRTEPGDGLAIYEKLRAALDDGFDDGRGRTGRYQCPACGARGDGHGLRVDWDPNRRRRILLVCDSQRCPLEEVLEPLGMTLAELCADDDTDDLGEDEEEVSSPPGEETDGAQLLDDVRKFLGRFVAFPSSHAQVAVTLWAAHTHLVAQFDSTPRLALLSPEKQSGKTRTLEILDLLCAGPERLSDASAAFIFRRIGQGEVTVELDECDAIWKRRNSDESAEALRSIVNAGHRKGATVGRVEMDGKSGKLVRFPVYAPVALAGIGGLPDTILDRSVIVRMRRRAPDEKVEEYRERTTRPEGEGLRVLLADWCASVAEKIGDQWPDMPAGVHDRPADVWEPLLVVADLAGGRWPELARAACVAFVDGSREDVASLGVRLLGDLRDIFGEHEVVSTETILGKLHALEEAPWGDWYGKPLDSRGLAKLLKPYGICSTKVRIGEASVRGYRRDDLWDAWSRYLAPPSGTSGTSGTPLASTVPDVPDVPPEGPKLCAVCGKPLQPYYVKIGRDLHPGCRPPF
jgi:Protein of unknown function (DUF3631)